MSLSSPQLLNEPHSDLAEEIEIALLPVIRISVVKSTPPTFVKNQRDLGVDLVADIYTMRIVLGCGKDQLRRLNNAGIQIYGAR